MAEHAYRSPQQAQTAARKFFERYCTGVTPGGKRRTRRGGKRRAASSGAALIKAAKALEAAWR